MLRKAHISSGKFGKTWNTGLIKRSCTSKKRSGKGNAEFALKDNKEEQLRLMELVALNKGIRRLEDWYQIGARDFTQNGANVLLSLYNYSPTTVVTSLFPNFPWDMHLFKHKPRSFWHDKENQRKRLDQVAKKIGIKHWTDWYQVQTHEMVSSGGTPLLSIYGFSVSRTLQAVYPEHDWQFDVREKRPPNFWKDAKNLREYFDQLAVKLNITDWTSWYKVNKIDIIENGGAGLLHRQERISDALMKAYPEHAWKVEEFKTVAEGGYWLDKKNQKKYLDELFKKLNMKSLDDWYNVTTKTFVDNGGLSLLSVYEGSYERALRSNYPEHDWKSYLFSRTKSEYWEDEANVKDFLQYATKKLHIESFEDWLKLSAGELRAIGGSKVLRKYGGLSNVLARFFPRSFDQKNSKIIDAKTEKFLFRTVKELYPNIGEIYSNFVSDHKFPNGNKMTFDVYIPSLKIAFEYQGIHHYAQSYYTSNEKYTVWDQIKQEACTATGIALIQIPYWWDRKPYSLAATIHKVRPEAIKLQVGNPIPDSPPTHLKLPPQKMGPA